MILGIIWLRLVDDRDKRVVENKKPLNLLHLMALFSHSLSGATPSKSFARRSRLLAMLAVGSFMFLDAMNLP